MKETKNSMSKKVYSCPYCKKRVFDANEEGTATITIKCGKCKQIVDVTIYSSMCKKSVMGCKQQEMVEYF